MQHENDIIIVGNGPSLLNNPYGAEIDSFGTIVRMNKFKLNPVENTGIKTSIWATKRLYASDVDFKNLSYIMFMLINHRHTAQQKRLLQKRRTTD